jgi:hypothetical protein
VPGWSAQTGAPIAGPGAGPGAAPARTSGPLKQDAKFRLRELVPGALVGVDGRRVQQTFHTTRAVLLHGSGPPVPPNPLVKSIEMRTSIAQAPPSLYERLLLWKERCDGSACLRRLCWEDQRGVTWDLTEGLIAAQLMIIESRPLFSMNPSRGGRNQVILTESWLLAAFGDE